MNTFKLWRFALLPCRHSDPFTPPVDINTGSCVLRIALTSHENISGVVIAHLVVKLKLRVLLFLIRLINLHYSARCGMFMVLLLPPTPDTICIKELSAKTAHTQVCAVFRRKIPGEAGRSSNIVKKNPWGASITTYFLGDTNEKHLDCCTPCVYSLVTCPQTIPYHALGSCKHVLVFTQS